ncbi:MAG: HAD family hydrolase [Candidatus Dormibacteraeota bacterium]|jgi:2-haloacid dehalogenase|nr:HAD family hydrolase [Candidatus Dormibacteraeota bacterium]
MVVMRWLTFDCYGTLVDWRAGIAGAIKTVAPGESERLLPMYYRHEVQVQAEGFRPYREVLHEALLRAVAEAGLTLDPGAGWILSDTLPDWPVFPDVGPALGKLREEGWQLGILSNIDPDLFAQTRQRLPVPVDAVVTAQDVGSYKPAHGHFLRFRETYRPDVQVHVAQSWFHDVVPANRLGIPAIWINRLGDDDDPSVASAVLPDLRELPATVSRVAASLEQDRRS